MRKALLSILIGIILISWRVGLGGGHGWHLAGFFAAGIVMGILLMEPPSRR